MKASSGRLFIQISANISTHESIVKTGALGKTTARTTTTHLLFRLLCGAVTRTMSIAQLLRNNREATEVQLSEPSATDLPALDLSWALLRANSKHWFTTSFLQGGCRKATLGVWAPCLLTLEEVEAEEKKEEVDEEKWEWLTKYFGGGCRKAMLGVCLEDPAPPPSSWSRLGP